MLHKPSAAAPQCDASFAPAEPPHSAALTDLQGLGIYVHFPWCLTKCPYCDFLSIAVPGPEAGKAPSAEQARRVLPHERYAQAVQNELLRRLAWLPQPLPPLRSIFFGGGTPSLWKPEALGGVIQQILTAWSLRDASEIEITVECNPTSLEAEQIAGLLRVGVNRLSIGVQSLHEERLQFLGRLHHREGALSVVQRALQAQVPRVSADLIYGVFQQRPEDAVREVELIAATGVSHLSAYALTIEPNTRFGALARRGQLPLLDEAQVAYSFSAVSEALRAQGFEHYEISNFARPGSQSIHNRGYWLGRDYLGLGTGAVGTVSGVSQESPRLRYKNLLVPERYMDLFSQPTDSHSPFDHPGADRELIDGPISVQESLLLGLRLEQGVDLQALAEHYQTDPWTRERTRAIQRLQEQGKLSLSGSVLRIPREHWLFADGIIRELL